MSLPIKFEDCHRRVGTCTDGVSPVWAGACQCAECGKQMSFCWDTVCTLCHATLCYEHSWLDEREKHWYCSKCAPLPAKNANVRRPELLHGQVAYRF